MTATGLKPDGPSVKILYWYQLICSAGRTAVHNHCTAAARHQRHRETCVRPTFTWPCYSCRLTPRSMQICVLVHLTVIGKAAICNMSALLQPVSALRPSCGRLQGQICKSREHVVWSPESAPWRRGTTCRFTYAPSRTLKHSSGDWKHFTLKILRVRQFVWFHVDCLFNFAGLVSFAVKHSLSDIIIIIIITFYLPNCSSFFRQIYSV